MANTLNRQKGDLTDMGSRLAQCQKRLDEAESAREELSSELCVATERAQVSLLENYVINANFRTASHKQPIWPGENQNCWPVSLS